MTLKRLIVALAVLAGSSAWAEAQDVAAPLVDSQPAPEFRVEVKAPERPAMLMPLYLGNAVMHGLDVHSTVTALNAGHREANPLLSGRSTGAMIGMKAAASLTSIYLSEKLWKRNRVAAVVVMVGINGALMAVAANNYRIAHGR